MTIIKNHPAKNKPGFSILAAQIQVNHLDFDANWDRIESIFINSNQELTLFPEAATSGFPYQRLLEVASVNKRRMPNLLSLARKHRRGVLLPLLWEENEKFYNRLFLVNPDGTVAGTYDKRHLIGVLHEDRFLTPGNQFIVLPYQNIDSDYTIRIGLATCYDLRFPEHFRNLVYKGNAEILLLPAMWPMQRRDHFYFLQIARAIENQLPMISCNAVGSTGSLELCGESMITNERGEVLARASATDEQRLIFHYNREDVIQWRQAFPVLEDSALLND